MRPVPTIDIAPLFETDFGAWQAASDQLGAAFRDTGFACIVGTGVVPTVVEALRDAVKELFALDEATKHRRAISRDNYRGFIPLGFFSPNDGTGPVDQYEGYKLHAEVAADDPIRLACDLYGPNLWPPECPGLAEVVGTYWAELDRVASALLAVFCNQLGMAQNRLDQAFTSPLTNMTLLHYPKADTSDHPSGIHPHKDTDAFTIIAPDEVGGLEVQRRDRSWVAVSCPPDGFVVNIGDMMELYSGGRFVSTPHKVENRSGKSRYSFPYFAVPRFDEVVKPLIEPLAGFDRAQVHCGLWSAEIWRTNWTDQPPRADTPELGTLR